MESSTPFASPAGNPAGALNQSVFNSSSLKAALDGYETPRAPISRERAKKLLVLVAGTKGGVGKTMLCEQLFCYYRQVFGMVPQFFDCDTSHFGLSRRLGLEPRNSRPSLAVAVAADAAVPESPESLEVPDFSSGDDDFSSPSKPLASGGFDDLYGDGDDVGIFSEDSGGMRGSIEISKDTSFENDPSSVVKVADTLQEVVSLFGASSAELAIADLPAATGANEASISSFLDGLTLDAFEEYGIRVVVLHIQTMSVDSVMASIRWMVAFKDLPHVPLLCPSNRPSPFDASVVYPRGSESANWLTTVFAPKVLRIPYYDEKGYFDFSKGLGNGFVPYKGNPKGAPSPVCPFLLKLAAFTENAAYVADVLGRDFVSKSSKGKVVAAFEKFRERYRALAYETWGDPGLEFLARLMTESAEHSRFLYSCGSASDYLTLPSMVSRMAELDDSWGLSGNAPSKLPLSEKLLGKLQTDSGRASLVRFLPNPKKEIPHGFFDRFVSVDSLLEVAQAVFESELGSGLDSGPGGSVSPEPSTAPSGSSAAGPEPLV